MAYVEILVEEVVFLVVEITLGVLAESLELCAVCEDVGTGADDDTAGGNVAVQDEAGLSDLDVGHVLDLDLELNKLLWAGEVAVLIRDDPDAEVVKLIRSHTIISMGVVINDGLARIIQEQGRVSLPDGQVLGGGTTNGDLAGWDYIRLDTGRAKIARAILET